MGENSKIEWTQATWTPVRARRRDNGKVGWHCVHKSTGCEFCYSERLNMRLGTGLPFKPGHEKDIELFLDEKMLTAPLRWKRPRMIFCCSMTDLFADFVDLTWIDKLFAVMAMAPQHTFQVLTKRPERMFGYLADVVEDQQLGISRFGAVALWCGLHGPAGPAPPGWPLPNVWLGVSAERQEEADERVPLLLRTPAAVRFLSAEPLLGPLDISPYLGNNPVHEVEAQRRVRLSSDSEWRFGNHAGRHGLAPSETSLGSLAKKGRQPPVQTSKGGARLRGLLPSSDHDGRREDLRASASTGLSSFQRADSGRSDDQSWRRQEEEQHSEQSGVSDSFAAADSRHAGFESRACLRSGRPEEQYGETNIGSSSADQAASDERRAASPDSERLRDQLSRGIENSSRRPLGGIIWTIVGGESGPHARPMHPDWARSLRDQCQAAGVTFFFKQWGEFRPGGFRDGEKIMRVGKKAAGRLLDGRTWDEMPNKEVMA